MHDHSPPTGPGRPGLMARLAANPSGVPRWRAIRLALLGISLGVSMGLIIHAFGRGAWVISVSDRGLGLLLSSLSGAILAPLGVMLVARLLDRMLFTDDLLLGYSGLIALLLHAGELSFLGALAAGIGAGVGRPLPGLVSGVVVTGIIGAVRYRVRGLGLLLGLTIGIMIGAIGGTLGGVIHALSG